MAMFSVVTGARAGHETFELRDEAAGSSVVVVPTLGNACVAFRVTTASGNWHVLDEPPDADALVRRTTNYGIPILYPWPNRVRGGVFTFRGRRVQLPTAGAGPHAIHGLTRLMPWNVEASGTDRTGAFIRCAVQVGGGQSPFPFATTLRVEYRLSGQSIGMRAEATNDTTVAAPTGFGIHPWFTLPLGPNGSRDACMLTLPAREIWELEELVTTGRRLPVPPDLDLRDGRTLAALALDHVYTGLALEDGWCTATVDDTTNARRIEVASDAAFREHVVYAPSSRNVVCLEPYTCTTDAFNLDERGVDAGTVALLPGQRWSGTLVVRARQS
ncbi:MAG: aldose 1-epimerase [Chloroflexota bacterium]